MTLKPVKYSLNWDAILVWGSVLLGVVIFWGWFAWRVL